MLHRLRALGLLFAALALGCGEGIALDPAATQPPPGPVRGDDGGDAPPIDGSDRDGSGESGEGQADVAATDSGVDVSDADGGREQDRAAGDAIAGDTLPDVSRDASAETKSDASDDASDVSPDISSDGFADTRLDAADASLDLAGDITLDALDARWDTTDVSGDAGDVAEDGARDGASYDVFDGCTVECWPAADYYVDASAPLGGTGSKLQPFKTITAAIQAYQASSGGAKKAYVAAGTYDESLGESFPLVLRGLSLEGAGRDRTFIVGVGAVDHAAEGGVFDGRYTMTMVVGDRTLPTRLTALSVSALGPVPTQNIYGVFCDRGNATGDVPSPGGQTQLDQVKVGPGYERGVVVAASTLPSVTGCEMSMTRSIVTGAWIGVQGLGCDWFGVLAPVTLEIGADDPSSGNTFSWIQAQYNPASGVWVSDCVLRASIQYNTFVDSMVGVTVGETLSPSPSSEIHASVRHNTFERLSVYGYWDNGSLGFLDELSDNSFLGISAGAGIPVPGRGRGASISIRRTGRVRRNQFIGNDVGVEATFSFTDISPGPPADFGTLADPGGNVFRCNSSMLDYGADLLLNGTPDTATTVRAAGNAWDHVPPTVQTVDPMPNGTDIAVLTDPGITVDRRNSTLSTAVCPDGRVPGQ